MAAVEFALFYIPVQMIITWTLHIIRGITFNIIKQLWNEYTKSNMKIFNTTEFSIKPQSREQQKMVPS